MAYAGQAARTASAALFPLDAILGSVASVRVLRVLSQHGGQLAAPDIAARSGLSRTGAWNALTDLVAFGIIEATGTGRSVLFQVATSHPLSAQIKGLFARENERVGQFLDAVRRAANRPKSGILAVWLFGSVARGEDVASSDLDIAVLIAGTRQRSSVERLAKELAPIATKQRFVLSVISLTMLELRELSVENPEFWYNLVHDVIVLKGEHPEAYV